MHTIHVNLCICEILHTYICKYVATAWKVQLSTQFTNSCICCANTYVCLNENEIEKTKGKCTNDQKQKVNTGTN